VTKRPSKLTRPDRAVLAAVRHCPAHWNVDEGTWFSRLQISQALRARGAGGYWTHQGLETSLERLAGHRTVERDDDGRWRALELRGAGA
jgi:hypothetical protein